MDLIKRKKKILTAVLGWAAALICALGCGFYIKSICSEELALALYVDGEELCHVEDKDVVDRAMALLNKKLDANGVTCFDEKEITYKYVNVRSYDPVSDEECMQLLYKLTADKYQRAYMISVGDKDIAACPTYAETEKVVTEFKDYIIKYLLENTDITDDVELTTEFTIKNVLCLSKEVSSADDICSFFVGNADCENGASEGEGGDRVNASGSSFLNSSDRYLSFGPIKNGLTGEVYDNKFSFNVNGVQSAIEYKTVITERYSEIIVRETEYIESDELYVGETKVITEGEDGIAENTYSVSYADGVEVSRELSDSVMISEPKKKVVLVGTRQLPSTEPSGIFMWPIKDRMIITSDYGINREEFDGNSYHTGIDISGMSMGTPIYAADGGEVIFAGEKGTYGLLVILRHEDGVETYYAHARKLDVEVGDKVYKGQQIAEVGMTGVATGPHVHFEVRIDGKTVNPINYLPKK